MAALERLAAERVAAMAVVARRYDPGGRLDHGLRGLAKVLMADCPPADDVVALREMALAVLGVAPSDLADVADLVPSPRRDQDADRG